VTEPSESDDYQVVIVRYGTRSTMRSEVYLNYGVYGEPDGPIGMDYFFWILRNRRRTICVDTGFSRPAGDKRGRTMLVDPAQAYADLGIAAADAPTVIVTHAHYDHIGNLALFPASKVVISQRELDFWTGPYARRAQFHHSAEDTELAALDAAQAAGRVEAFSGTARVAPGVEVIELGGHTPGQAIVRVQTSQGPVLLASDAVHYYEEYERDMPFAHVADLELMYAGFDSIRAMLNDGSVQHLVTGHDPGTLARFGAPGEETPGLAALTAVIGRLT
jgi:glyoxylase-like metal-dependent hydrolase (beta-lactamase superfamily II)